MDTLEKMYDKMTFRFKLDGPLGGKSKRKRGMVQGMSASILASQILMGIWTRMIEDERKIKTSGYIDDTSIRTAGKEEEAEEEVAKRLCDAWARTKDFDRESGIETNIMKTKLWATTAKLEKI